MKTLILYHSAYHKNTENIAKVFAATIHADLVSIENAKQVNFNDYELIGFGSGVYRESMSTKLIDFVKGLEIVNRDVFVFSTSGAGMKYYNKKLIHLLEAKGLRCKGSFSCKGSYVSSDFTKNKIFKFFSKLAEGHPDEKDLSNAEEFILKIIDRT